MTAATVTTDAGALKAVLRAAVAAADTNGHPTLDHLLLQANAGTLTATATDRFVAVHARCDANGTLPPTALYGPDVRRFWVRLLRRAEHPNEQVAIDLSSTRVTLTIAGGLSCTLPHEEDNVRGLPVTALDKAFRKAASGEAAADLARHMAFTPEVVMRAMRILHRAAHDRRPFSGGTAQWTVAGRMDPVLIELHNWLSILLMPARLTDGDGREVSHRPHLPYGLPAQEQL